MKCITGSVYLAREVMPSWVYIRKPQKLSFGFEMLSTSIAHGNPLPSVIQLSE